MKGQIKGCVFEHYKGNLYLVIGSAIDSGSDKESVLYTEFGSNNKDNKVFTTTRERFFEDVEYNGETVKRFTKVYEPVKKTEETKTATSGTGREMIEFYSGSYVRKDGRPHGS